VSSLLRSRARGFTVLAILAGACAVLLYLVFVRTPIGQRWDDRAYLGSLVASLESRQRITSILHEIRISTLVLMVILLLVIGLLRRRFATAVITAVAFGGAVLSAEVLKRVLHRPDLAPDMNSLINESNIDTFPSGHATIATAFALGLLIVSSLRARLWIATFGMLWAAGISTASLIAGWHRPSDLIGGIALATAWLAAATAFTTGRFGRIRSVGDAVRWLIPVGAGVLLLAVGVLLAWISRGDTGQIPVGGGLAAFFVGAAIVATSAITVVGVFAYLLRDLSFGPAETADLMDASQPN